MALPDVGYVEETIQNPGSDLTDYTWLVWAPNSQTHKLPTDYWNADDTSGDASKLRASTVTAGGTEREAARDPINFVNNGNGTGDAQIRGKWDGTLSATGTQKVRLYRPDSTLTAYTASDTFGQHNAYDSSWVGYWPMDSDFNDRTGNNNDGTAAGDVTGGNATGQVGSASDFDGTGDRVDISAATEFEQASVMILAWINPDTLQNTSADTLFDYNSFGSAQGVQIFASGADELTWRRGDGTNNQALALSGWTLSAWQMLTATDDGTTATLQRNDGTPASESSNALSWGNVDPWSIGDQNGGTGIEWDGGIDDFQWHSTVRSAAWISEEYSQTNDQDAFWSLAGGTWTWNAPAGGGVTVPAAWHHLRQMHAA